MIYYVIPARSGSKGLPGKNRLLFRYTADAIRKDNHIKTIVTTDDDVVYRMAVERGFIAVAREDELSNDTANTRDVLIDVVNRLGLKSDDIIVMLYLTYPTRNYNKLAFYISMFVDQKCKSMLGRMPAETHPYQCITRDGKQVVEHDLCRRQDYPEVYEISHSIIITKVSEIPKLNSNLYNNETTFIDVDKYIDVDTVEDLCQALAEL